MQEDILSLYPCPLPQQPDTKPLTIGVAFPQGTRVNATAMMNGLTVLRTDTQDMVVFDTSVWAAAPVQIPLAAGDGSAFAVWVLDPCSLPATAADTEGFLLRADKHASQPLLDALTGQGNGRYARYDVALAVGYTTGYEAPR